VRNYLRKIIAYFRLNKKVVCEESAKGPRDYHDYKDSTLGKPWHYYRHVCARCGKAFTI
jgi:hypothetical protein